MANGQMESDNLFLKKQRNNPNTMSMMGQSQVAMPPNKWAAALMKRRGKGAVKTS